MAIFLIILLIWVLYLRTLNYRYIIDDWVKRDGYMYDVPLVQPPASLYRTHPAELYRCFMIGMHCFNTWFIYSLWGWAPALLFAVHPMAVWGVAWVTGNYYATTTFFCLEAYYILVHFPNVWGVLVAMPIFAAALNSTICGISFPFLFLLTGNIWGCFLFIPLIIFLKGKRFTTGMKIRDSFKVNKPLKTPFTYKRLFLMTKVMGKYITDCIWPDKLGIFSPYGHSILDKKEVYDKYEAPNLDFWKALAVCLIVGIGGLFVSPVGTLWLFLCIGLHSQWRLTGQFYAQRYLYFALVGFCVVVGLLIQSHPILVAVIATFLIFRTYLFIPAFSNIESFYLNDLEAWPDCAQNYNNLAQIYLNNNSPEKPMPAWRINQIGYLLFKAEEMEPTDWSIKMNVACFFSLIQQWPQCIQKTTEALTLVKPLGGPDMPVKILDDQTKKIAKVMEDNKNSVMSNLTKTLEDQIKYLIDLIEQQKEPALLSVSTGLKNTMSILEEKKPELGYNLIMDISNKLNDLIRTVEKGKVISDPDIIQIKVNLDLMLEKKRAAEAALIKQQGAAISSPPNAQTEQKVGEKNG